MQGGTLSLIVCGVVFGLGDRGAIAEPWSGYVDRHGRDFIAVPYGESERPGPGHDD